MKTELHRPGHGVWSLLTDVPDQPRAGAGARLLRALPIALPLAALLLLGGWELAIRSPQAAAARRTRAPLLALEHSTAALRNEVSEQQTRELAAQAGELRHSLPADLPAVEPVWRSLEQAAARWHWTAHFHTLEAPAAPEEEKGLLGVANARGTLEPAPGNDQPWATLIVLLDDFSAPGRQIDLTRLVIRADEHNRYSVETHLRLAYLLTHAKAAQ